MLSWIVTNVISALVLPPTIFLLLIALGLWKHRRRWGRCLAYGSLALLLIIATPVVAYSLQDALQRRSSPLTSSEIAAVPKRGSMVVVLTGGKRLGALEYPGGEAPSDSSVERGRYAVSLARQTGLPLAIAGGKPAGGQLSEAALLQAFVEDELKFRVSLIEQESLNTHQSAALLTPQLQRLGISDLVLVTDVLHMQRAVPTFASVGFRVIPAPMNFQAAPNLTPVSFIPSSGGLALSSRALHELLGELWYAALRSERART